MGLLEEAIREHLELKRKHGASDDELLREESDALGPARRDQGPVEHAQAEPEAAVEDELEQDESEHDVLAAPPADAGFEEPEPPSPEPPPGELMEGPEESPDFSQEPPDRERLAFEQKPRRDFDFD